MSSLIVHSDSYLAMDLQKFCDPATADNDATVSMRETQAILNTTEGWSVAVSGFAVDLSRSFYFHDADPNVVITYRSHVGDVVMLEDVRTLDIRTFSFAQFISHLQPSPELRDDLPQIVVNEVGGIRVQPSRKTHDNESFSVEFSTEAANKLGLVINHDGGVSRSPVNHQVPKTVQSSSGITQMFQRIQNAYEQTGIARELQGFLLNPVQGASSFSFDVPFNDVVGNLNPLGVVLPRTIEFDSFSDGCTTGLRAVLGAAALGADERLIQRVIIHAVDPAGNCEIQCFLRTPFVGQTHVQGDPVTLDHPILLEALLFAEDIYCPPVAGVVNVNLNTEIVIPKVQADRLGSLYRDAKPTSFGVGTVTTQNGQVVRRTALEYVVNAPLVFRKNNQPVDATFGGDYDECLLYVSATVAQNFQAGDEVIVRPMTGLVQVQDIPAPLYRPWFALVYEQFAPVPQRPNISESFGAAAEIGLDALRFIGDEQETLFNLFATHLPNTILGANFAGVTNLDRSIVDLDIGAVVDAQNVSNIACATVFEVAGQEADVEFLSITIAPPNNPFFTAFTALPGQQVQMVTAVGTLECTYHRVDQNQNIELVFTDFRGGIAQADFANVQAQVNGPGLNNVFITMGQDNEFYGISRGRAGDLAATAPNTRINLRDGSKIESQYALPDSLQTFSSIGIVSRDLLVTPVVSGGYKEALLHQFPLPMSFGLGYEKDMSVSGASYSPPGVVTWRTRGYLLPHKIVMGNSPLNRFSISATLRHKDKSLDPVLVKLPPHGEFSLQMLLLRNAQA